MSDYLVAVAEQLDAEPATWRLWFAARLGPPRTAEVTIGGHKVKIKRRRLELPPTKNTRDGAPYVHGKWIKEWRDAAKAEAEAQGIPPCDRIRISAVVYRDRIGIADAENDHARLAPLQDGIVDAGVVPKDTYRFVERGAVSERRADERGPGIELIVEALTRAAGPPAAGQDGRE